MNDNDKWGCSINIAELAFLMLLYIKLFSDIDVDWWVIFVPIIAGIVYDIAELVIKARNKDNKDEVPDGGRE